MITFEWGMDKRMIDYLAMRRGDSSILKNVKC
jgi:hypothetical protein